jgi:hypothetical protein
LPENLWVPVLLGRQVFNIQVMRERHYHVPMRILVHQRKQLVLQLN